MLRLTNKLPIEYYLEFGEDSGLKFTVRDMPAELRNVVNIVLPIPDQRIYTASNGMDIRSYSVPEIRWDSQGDRAVYLLGSGGARSYLRQYGYPGRTVKEVVDAAVAAIDEFNRYLLMQGGLVYDQGTTVLWDSEDFEPEERKEVWNGIIDQLKNIDAPHFARLTQTVGETNFNMPNSHVDDLGKMVNWIKFGNIDQIQYSFLIMNGCFVLKQINRSDTRNMTLSAICPIAPGHPFYNRYKTDNITSLGKADEFWSNLPAFADPSFVDRVLASVDF